MKVFTTCFVIRAFETGVIGGEGFYMPVENAGAFWLLAKEHLLFSLRRTYDV